MSDGIFIGVPMDRRQDDGMPFERVGPAGRSAADGADSNVHPALYGAAAMPQAQHEPLDMPRDGLVMVRIRRASSAGLPVRGICRGGQELVVANGGTLDTEIQCRAASTTARRRSVNWRSASLPAVERARPPASPTDFVLGVQSHPEGMPAGDRASAALFAAFIAAADAFRQRRA